MNRLFPIVICLLAASGWATAEGDEVAHTVDFPAGDAAWTVTLLIASGGNKPDIPAPAPGPGPSLIPPAIHKVDVVRKGNLRHDTLTYANGRTGDWWWTDNPALTLFQDRPGGPILTFRASQMGESRYDQSTFLWVKQNTYKGMKAYRGKNCRYYEMEIPLADGETRTLKAWIDEKTARPVCWGMSNLVAVFTFDKPLPDNPLIMPQNYQAEFDHAAAALQPPKQFGVH